MRIDGFDNVVVRTKMTASVSEAEQPLCATARQV